MPQARWLRELGVRCFAAIPLLAAGRLHGVVAFASRTRDEFREDDLQVIRTVCDQVSAMLERVRLVEELHANERSLKRADRAQGRIHRDAGARAAQSAGADQQRAWSIMRTATRRARSRRLVTATSSSARCAQMTRSAR